MAHGMNEERRRASRPLNIAVAVGAMVIYGYAGDASAACRRVREVTPETYFEGQRCQSNGVIQLNGRYQHLYTGERLEGTVVRQMRRDGASIQKQGNLKSPMFEGVLSADSQVDRNGIISSREERSGMEDLGAEGRFEGSMRTERFDQELRTVRQGYLRSPTHELVLNADSQVDRNGNVMARTKLNGTWMVGEKRFVGSLVIERFNDQVVVRDERREDPI